MKNINKYIGLYLILDGEYIKNFTRLTKVAIENDVKVIQYRHKKTTTSERIKNAKKIKKTINNEDVILIVNDDLEAAKESAADGIHIGQSDEDYTQVRKALGNKIIGISTHSIEQALHAEKKGADYIGIGPVYSTKTKKNSKKPIGLEELKMIVNKVKIPTVAIGGINKSNIKDVLKTGVSGIAMISAILKSNQIEQEIKKIRNMIKKEK